MATAQEAIQRALRNANTIDPSRKVYNPLTKLDKLPSLERLPSISSQFSFNQDLDTSTGLYNLAVQSNLRPQADKIIKDNSGEELKEIFSGGFISDTFDVLNLLSFGTVGVLKGKGFMEGVKNRESFSDKDALGQFGLTGILGGLVLDIATDPLTYIAPWTVLRKVPGVIRIAKVAKETAFGKRISKPIQGTELSFSELQGGVRPLRFVAEKFQWMFGADPVFKETYEQMLRSAGVGVRKTFL